MAELAILTPTRGRPDRFADLIGSIAETAATDWELWGAIDSDDQSDYFEPAKRVTDELGCGDRVQAIRGERRSLSAWTNELAHRLTTGGHRRPPRYLASLGDDHRPRTPGWDRQLIEAIESLDGPGIAYGDDLFAGARLPTAWVMSVEAVRKLGWMMLPTCDHMYVDNAILTLGVAAQRIIHCPDVVIEHLHPLAGKAEWDTSYNQSNTSDRYDADRRAFERWHRDELRVDVARLVG